MVTAILQRDLVEEVGKIIKDIQTKDTMGNEVFGATGYEQQLPVVAEDEDDVSKRFPYYIVRVEQGSTADDDSPWVVQVGIYFGVYNPAQDTNGHRSLVNMIQRVADRFAAEPLLNGMFRANQDMSFALQEEDTYPFFFGGLQINFQVPKIQRKDPYVI